jgi:hypothetical protein
MTDEETKAALLADAAARRRPADLPTPGQRLAVGPKLLAAIVSTINAVRRATDTRLDELDRRVAAIETRPEVRYMGIYRDGDQYCAGALCTRSGALWLAEAPTTGVPGTAASGWRLVVKSGGAT